MIADKYERFRPDVNFIKRYMDAANPATGSDYDPNSNVASKSCATLAAETGKRAKIYTNRLMMYDKLCELYDEKTAEKYISDLESHRVYRHDETGQIPTPYCASITLYPFLLHGIRGLGGTTDAPKHLSSFAGGFINLVFAASAQVLGAIATPEFLAYLNYFICKEYGTDYYEHLDRVVDHSARKRTIDQVITDTFCQIVYSINQPAAARGNQAVFWNVAYFDKPYYHALFEDFVFPDGTGMEDLWPSCWFLQKRFMTWFNKERTRKPLTFPVETFSLLNDGTDYVDKEAADWVAHMYSQGHSFFTYTSNSVDSLASCCYSGDTLVMVKDANGAHLVPIKDVENMTFDPNGYRIFNNGKWSKGRLVKLPARKMYRIRTSNGKEMVLTDNHRNNCLGGMKLTRDLTCDDYIMFNSTPADTYPEKNEHLTYEQGFAIGAFLGDGSFGSTVECVDGSSHIHDTNFSLCEKKRRVIPVINEALKQLGCDAVCKEGTSYNNVIPVRVSSKSFVSFITRWTNWKRGVRSFDKEVNMDCLLQSIEFRRGILDGWLYTDGTANSVKTSGVIRGYTASTRLCDCMEAIATSIGLITSRGIDERKDPPVFRGIAYNKNYPIHSLLVFSPHKHSRLTKDRGVFRDNSYYMKIVSVEPCEYTDPFVYCFEMEDPTDDKFTLPNGIHNYNCRLQNGIQDTTFSYSLGAGGVATGSKCVMSININRLVQDAVKSHTPIRKAVTEQVDLVHKYLTAFNAMVKEAESKHMLPLYDAGFVKPEKQYLTVGVNGVVESAEFLGITISDNEDYRRHINNILEPIYELNKAHRTADIMFNTEFVPGESLGVKNAAWDKAAGYVVPRPCYNSYFYIVEDENTSPLDKFTLHGRNYTSKLDGGSALHCNLKEHLSKSQYDHLLKVAIQEGCNYFTFNIPNTLCNDCGHIDKRFMKACPKCESKNVDWLTRVIGYLVRVKNMSGDRQKEAEKRYYA